MIIKDRKLRFTFRDFFSELERAGKVIRPFCSHFELCGGCILQHIPYELQIELKRKIAEREFRKNDLSISFDDFFPSEKTKFYRNRMDYAVAKTRNGRQRNTEIEQVGGNLERSDEVQEKVIVGLREYGKWWRTIDIKECYLLSEDTPDFLDATREFLTERKISGYDPVSQQGEVRYIVIREGKNTGKKLITIITSSENFPFHDFLTFVKRRFGDKKISFSHAISRSPANVSFGDVIDFRGDELSEKVLGFEFRIPPFSFFQTNTYMAEKLVSTIIDFVKDWSYDDLADLYSGVGLFSICLAENFRYVYGVELDEDAVFYAEQNAILNGVKNIRFVRGRVEQLVRKVSADVVLVDPPRAGLGKKVVKGIINIKRAKKLIYVSCNPESFARDMKMLLSSHFKVDALFGFDFFPHTKHFELLAFLSRT